MTFTLYCVVLEEEGQYRERGVTHTTLKTEKMGLLVCRSFIFMSLLSQYRYVRVSYGNV